MRKLISSLAAMAALTLSGPAVAAKAYGPFGPNGNLWLIVCNDGSSHSFAGSASGAAGVGAYLCPGGAIVTPVRPQRAEASAQALGTSVGAILAGTAPASPKGINQAGVKRAPSSPKGIQENGIK